MTTARKGFSPEMYEAHEAVSKSAIDQVKILFRETAPRTMHAWPWVSYECPPSLLLYITFANFD